MRTPAMASRRESTSALLDRVEPAVLERALLDVSYRRALLRDPRRLYEAEIRKVTGTTVRLRQEIHVVPEESTVRRRAGVRYVRLPELFPASGDAIPLGDLEGVNPLASVLSPTNACTAQSGCGSCWSQNCPCPR